MYSLRLTKRALDAAKSPLNFMVLRCWRFGLLAAPVTQTVGQIGANDERT